jgi:L-alanine-DL-glutamate epimerase-like enolase superfamily enzyme
MQLAVAPVTLRLRAPLRAAWGTLTERTLLRVTLRAPDGLEGHGEAAPLEPYDGVPLAAVRAALDAYARVLADRGERPLEELVDACRAERDLPAALAAVDLALWDLAGRRAGRPVAQLVSVEAARSSAASVAFTGIERAATGHRMAIRIDANGAWGIEEAVANLGALAPVGLELAEEPVHGVEALRAVRAQVDVPLAMDETAAEPGAVGAGVTDAVCLKIARCGGISGVLRDAAAARATGAVPYLASSWDGPVGIAAGVHAAAGLHAGGPLPAHGLATLGIFADPPPGPVAVRGAIRVPRQPGLGVAS